MFECAISSIYAGRKDYLDTKEAALFLDMWRNYLEDANESDIYEFFPAECLTLKKTHDKVCFFLSLDLIFSFPLIIFHVVFFLTITFLRS